MKPENQDLDVGILKTFLNICKKISSRFLVLLIPYGWHILFFFVPFLIVLKISFTESTIGSPPFTSVFSWSKDQFLDIRLNLGNYLAIFDYSLYSASYLESLKNAAIATCGCLLLGYPMAYGITQLQGSRRKVCLMLVVLPFWTSFLIRIYAWIHILSPKGLLNNFLTTLGLIDAPLKLLDTNIAVIIGLIYSYLPFMIMPLYASLEKIPPELLEAAYDLGTRPLKTFFKIVVPVSYRGIAGGAMLVFIPAVGEYVIPTLLGGSNSIMIGKVLWFEFSSINDWPRASALMCALFVCLFLPIMLFQRMINTTKQPRVAGDEDA